MPSGRRPPERKGPAGLLDPGLQPSEFEKERPACHPARALFFDRRSDAALTWIALPDRVGQSMLKEP